MDPASPVATDATPATSVRARQTGRRRAFVIGIVAVALVTVLAAGIAGLTRSGGLAGSGAVPHFVEEARAAGIDHTYGGDFAFAVGGGVATFDCDDDGRPELYLAGGGSPAALYHNDSPVGGALRFNVVADPATDLIGVEGAYPLDIDGDGHVDLAVLRAGDSVLLRGLGDCRFERANEAWSFDGGDGMATAFSATWEGSGALPTLAVGDYVKLDASGEPTQDCAEGRFYRPAGAAATTPRYAPPIALTPGYCALSMLFSDWDRSGRRDLRVSNDRHYYDRAAGEEQLWRIEPSAPPRAYTAADGWSQVQVEGMGIASYDVTGDGFPDVYLTSQSDNRLQALASGPERPTYTDIGHPRGVDVAQPFTGGDALPSTAWHADFQDINNDGLVDLFVAKGNISDQPDHAMKDPSNLLIGEADGSFREAAEQAGVLSFARGRGASLADLNLDGLLDLVEVNYLDRVMVWRNVGAGDATTPAPMGHWLSVRATQPGPNHDAIGAWIEVQAGGRTSRRELTVGGGHLSGALGWMHVGLGSATDAQVRVVWPDGEVGPWLAAPADGFGVIERGASAITRWDPQKDH
ncbi:MAG: CRTAC1 family protein [Chloroflexota bacterium]